MCLPVVNVDGITDHRAESTATARLIRLCLRTLTRGLATLGLIILLLAPTAFVESGKPNDEARD